MVGGKWEAKGALATVPCPTKGDPLYADEWNEDPDYEAGDSGTEDWR